MKGSDLILVGLLAVLLLVGSDGGTKLAAPPRKKLSGNEKKRVVAALAKYGYPEDELGLVIWRESGWNPAALNSIRAVGLIQLTPKTLKGLGYTGSPESFAALSIDEQLPYYEKFFAPHKGKYRTHGDTYMVTAAPAFIGAPDDQVVFPVDTNPKSPWSMNPTFRTANNGPITAGSIRWQLLKLMPARFEP